MIRAEVLAIGDELVHGQGLDTNSRAIARELEAAGLSMRRFTVVGDDPADLEQAMREACSRAAVVVATGGLGPTADDRTRDVAAALAGVSLVFDERSMARIEEWLKRRNRPVPQSNRRQAHLPEGAAVLDNPSGTAPGFRMRLGEATLFALPGVPREMLKMLEEHVLSWVAENVPGCRPVAHHVIRVLGPSEAVLGESIAEFMAAGRDPKVGVTAHYGQLSVRVVASGENAAAARAACEAAAGELRPRLRRWLVSEGPEELHELVVRRLLETDTTLATAESCTGGLLAARLTEVPGVSAVFPGGYVTYADPAKARDLGVPQELLGRQGAVSEEVAAAMAHGAAARAGARMAVAISGIAGPEGGSEAKPVGTVCFGLCRDAQARAWTVRIPDLGRTFVRERAVLEALAALARELGETTG